MDKRTKHGHKSGGSESRTYISWTAMCQRAKGTRGFTNQSKTERYIALGVCPEWKESFIQFLEDVGERPEGTSLDRLDNEKGYIKGNVRWATPKEQQRNRANNVFIEGQLLVEWCEDRGWPYPRVYVWLRKENYSVDQIKEKGELKWGKDQTL